MFLNHRTPVLPTPEQALRGRPVPEFTVPSRHTVLGNPLVGPYPEGLEVADFALGCFWGAERKFWQTEGVWTTLVGYQGGYTENPTYEEACSGLTGHTEAVRVVFDPAVVSYEELLRLFWESHNPTQGFRQGNDVGTQYRSAIYTHSPARAAAADASREAYQKVLTASGHKEITTEILPADGRPFWPAEAYHQQYLDKNPGGYCGIGGTGVSCPIGVASAGQHRRKHPPQQPYEEGVPVVGTGRGRGARRGEGGEQVRMAALGGDRGQVGRPGGRGLGVHREGLPAGEERGQAAEQADGLQLLAGGAWRGDQDPERVVEVVDRVRAQHLAAPVVQIGQPRVPDVRGLGLAGQADEIVQPVAGGVRGEVQLGRDRVRHEVQQLVPAPHVAVERGGPRTQPLRERAHRHGGQALRVGEGEGGRRDLGTAPLGCGSARAPRGA